MEKFAPVANDLTTRMVIAITLWYSADGWVCHSVDIEAAFLEGDAPEAFYLEWPPGSVQLGFALVEDVNTKCIKCKRAIYGNVNSALLWYTTYADYLRKKLGMMQSQADPCVFYKLNEQGQLVLIASCHVDDTLLAGTLEQIKWFKSALTKRFKIKDLGPLKKHLGIEYTWIREEDNMTVVASMDDLVGEIVEIVEKKLGKELRQHDVPALPGQVLMPSNEPGIDESLYQTVVGKIMYLVHKFLPEGLNAARELSKHFN